MRGLGRSTTSYLHRCFMALRSFGARVLGERGSWDVVVGRSVKYLQEKYS